MGQDLSYKSTREISDDVRGSILNDAAKLAASQTWNFSEPIVFSEAHGFLAGVSKVLVAPDGDGIETALSELEAIIQALQRWSRDHGVNWAIELDGMNAGVIRSGRLSAALREMIDALRDDEVIPPPPVFDEMEIEITRKVNAAINDPLVTALLVVRATEDDRTMIQSLVEASLGYQGRVRFETLDLSPDERQARWESVFPPPYPSVHLFYGRPPLSGQARVDGVVPIQVLSEAIDRAIFLDSNPRPPSVSRAWASLLTDDGYDPSPRRTKALAAAFTPLVKLAESLGFYPTAGIMGRGVSIGLSRAWDYTGQRSAPLLVVSFLPKTKRYTLFQFDRHGGNLIETVECDSDVLLEQCARLLDRC